MEESRILSNLEGRGERERDCDLEFSLERFNSSDEVIFPLFLLLVFLFEPFDWNSGLVY